MDFKSLFISLAALVSLQAFAAEPTEFWRPARFNVIVNGPQIRQTYSANVQRELHWTETVPYTAYRTEVREVLERTTCYKTECTGGSGKSPYWDAFFSAPKYEKADKLADAIQGVGKKSAEALVEYNVFSSKPRTWAQFADKIQSAADDSIIQKSVASQVLNKYREENLSRLGYEANMCTVKSYPCDQWVSQEVQVPYVAYREEQRSRVLEVLRRVVNVEVNGARLLPNEQDVVSVSIGRNDAVSVDQSNTANHYQVISSTSGDGSILLQFNQDARRKVQLPTNVVRNAYYGLFSGNQSVFTLDIDPAYLVDQNDPQSQLVLSYTVKVCTVGWTGYCSLFADWEDLGSATAVIGNARTQIPVNVPFKKRAKIVYSLTRTNSEFYNNIGTPATESAIINMPSR